MDVLADGSLPDSPVRALEGLRNFFESELERGLPEDPDDIAPTDEQAGIRAAIANVDLLLETFVEIDPTDNGSHTISLDIVMESAEPVVHAAVTIFDEKQFAVTTFFSSAPVGFEEACT